MISYVVQPNRFYPEIKNIINQKYKIGDYSNHLIINKTSKCFDYNSNKIKDINLSTRRFFDSYGLLVNG